MISVIVPVYNIEDYLSRCLDSILGQTYQDLEILLIDDGSSDNSGSICDIYASRDSRIRAIHQTNHGLSGARNTGLRNVSGEYVLMMDGDDALHPQMIETLYHLILGGDFDFAMCHREKVYDITVIPQLSATMVDTSNPIVLDRDTCIKHFYSSMTSFYVVWNKLYKREIIDSVFFADTAAEDVEFNNRIYLRMNKAIWLPVSLYYYIQRPDSILHQGGQSINLFWANTVFSWKLCLDAIPEKDTQYRALSLQHLFRLMPHKRYWSRGTPYYQIVIDNVRKLRKLTIGEFLSNPKVKLFDKIVFGVFNYCPYLYRFFISFTEYSARIPSLFIQLQKL